ncbi:2-hydroxyacid dehydrogenase [Tessaracoccus sp. SD287]|uniref:2-hydroxyacid dehydrogenase n=1 Tax=Tessaracoccus sp. SD287 TaxID=2782008 RepID=UPI001A96DAF4|nr:2-hydroxyacid dehydrogenase [Tessaracoccus sp. SD287]MBO1031581.1 2-hydroxyacid dehydrogenase [Tessaracoccus sp. SD287]
MSTDVKILLQGDGFVLPTILHSAIEEQGIAASTTSTSNSWPLTPMVDVGGVREANGDPDDLIAALQGHQVLFTHTAPVTAAVMDACPDLKLVVICRGGPVNADLAAATERGIVVCNTPGRNANATTEHSLAMILAAARQLAQRDAELKAGQWRSDHYRYEVVSPELFGSTVGLVGYGAIGRRVAQVMAVIGAHVLVYDPYLTEELPEGIEQVDDLADLLRRSDVLTIHARATADNVGLIGREQIALMPAGSVLVNCARPSLLDYDALCDALDSGHLYAAACDVLPAEPLPADHRLLHTPNITLTPHLAGASKSAAWIAARLGAADIAAFLRGERPRHVVNPEVYDTIG